MPPETVCAKATFGDKAVDMRIPLQVTSEGMQDTDEARSKEEGLVIPMEHAENDTADSTEETVQKGTIRKKEGAKLFCESKDTVTVLHIDDLEGHLCCAIDRIHVSTSGAEAAMTPERNKLQMSAVTAAIHSPAKGRVTTVDHLIHVFNSRRSWMQCIEHFFKMITEYFLKDIHRLIMKKNGTKQNPHPSRLRGRGS